MKPMTRWQLFGRKGGKRGKGAAKARTSAQARKAVMVRWDKRKVNSGKSGS